MGMAYLMLDMARTRPTVGVATVAPSPTAMRTIIHTPSPQPTVSMTRTPIQMPLTSLLETVLIVPTAGVNSPIVEVYVGDTSWDVSDLGNHVGHLQGTASWDDPLGNIGLAGHVERADGTKGVFANLGDVQVGDPIIVKRGGQQWNYVIRNLNRVDPNDISVLYPDDHSQITLITCDDYDLMNNTYRERLVVVAERVT
jgi:LPXTG-site transpeptidase (sortase) family protein